MSRYYYIWTEWLKQEVMDCQWSSKLTVYHLPLLWWVQPKSVAIMRIMWMSWWSEVVQVAGDKLILQVEVSIELEASSASGTASGDDISGSNNGSMSCSTTTEIYWGWTESICWPIILYPHSN